MHTSSFWCSEFSFFDPVLLSSPIFQTFSPCDIRDWCKQLANFLRPLCMTLRFCCASLTFLKPDSFLTTFSLLPRTGGCFLRLFLYARMFSLLLTTMTFSSLFMGGPLYLTKLPSVTELRFSCLPFLSQDQETRVCGKKSRPIPVPV